MEHIEISAPFMPGSVDIPVDKRGRIKSLDDIENIELPYVGMPFYVYDEKQLFVVTGLTEKPASPLPIENGMIGTYIPVGSKGKEFLFTQEDLEPESKILSIAGYERVIGVIDESGGPYLFKNDEITYEDERTLIDLGAFMALRSLNEIPGRWELVFAGGMNGKNGLNFSPDARGTLAERSQYDGENKGFSYLDVNAGVIYHKLSDNNWNEGFPLHFKPNETWATILYSGTINLSPENGNLQEITLTGNLNLISPVLDADNHDLLVQINCGIMPRTVTIDDTVILDGREGYWQIGWFWDGGKTRRYKNAIEVT